jgi:polyisoprenoid-binding protein YceI
MRYIQYILFFSFVFAEYVIDDSKSKVVYYGNHPLHAWSGITNSIAVSSECKSTNQINCNFEFRISFMSFYSGNDNRDSNMLYYLNAFLYPEIIMTFDNFIIREYNNSVIEGKLSINGTIKQIKIPIKVTLESEKKYSIKSLFSISLNDFNVEIPKLLFLSIDNDIKIDVDLFINKI